MKITCVFFLMIVWPALMGGTGYSAHADEAQQQNTKSSDQPVGHRSASQKKQPHDPASPSKANHPEQRGVSTGTPPVSQARPVRPQTVSRPPVPTPSNVRHRSPNPATVGGAANAGKSGAINGTRMSRKP